VVHLVDHLFDAHCPVHGLGYANAVRGSDATLRQCLAVSTYGSFCQRERLPFFFARLSNTARQAGLR
jgi:hypothetical protein